MCSSVDGVCVGIHRPRAIVVGGWEWSVGSVVVGNDHYT